jgi:hypothetical protein
MRSKPFGRVERAGGVSDGAAFEEPPFEEVGFEEFGFE